MWKTLYCKRYVCCRDWVHVVRLSLVQFMRSNRCSTHFSYSSRLEKRISGNDRFIKRITAARRLPVLTASLPGGLWLVMVVASRTCQATLQLRMVFDSQGPGPAGLNCRSRRHTLKSNIHAVRRVFSSNRIDKRREIVADGRQITRTHDFRCDSLTKGQVVLCICREEASVRLLLKARVKFLQWQARRKGSLSRTYLQTAYLRFELRDDGWCWQM